MPGRPAAYIREGREHEVAGRVADAIECYAKAVDLAAAINDPRHLAEALRRSGVLRHLRGEAGPARDLCVRSYDVGIQANALDAVVDAVNALAGFDFEHGWMRGARERYLTGLELAAGHPALVAKLEQNLGTLAGVQGDWGVARTHYHQALAAWEDAKDLRGCAMVYHNLGRIHAAEEAWEDAGRRYQAAQQLARAAGDVHLQALASLSQAELHATGKHYDSAYACADQALAVFRQLGARRDWAAAHRILGMILRETDRPAFAESHLRLAVKMADVCACPLEEADAARELAMLYHARGRAREALDLLQRARGIYQRLEARPDMAEVERRRRALDAA